MSRLPTKAEVLDWIEQNPTLTAKRDIAKAFGIKGAARIDLKRLLKELAEDGHLEKRRKTYRDPDRAFVAAAIAVHFKVATEEAEKFYREDNLTLMGKCGAEA